MSLSGSQSALSWALAGLGVGDEVFAAAAAGAGVLVVLLLALSAWQGERRRRGEREARRRAESAAAEREKELGALRVRLCGLEKALEEVRQALAASAGPAPAAATAAAAPPPPSPPAGPTAIVCVADALVARVYESMLATRGLRVRRCATGADALALAAEDRPAVSVIDLASAGPEPMKLLHAVCGSTHRGGRVLAIAADALVARAAAEAGAEVLMQPVDLVELARRLRGASSSEEARR